MWQYAQFKVRQYKKDSFLNPMYCTFIVFELFLTFCQILMATHIYPLYFVIHILARDYSVVALSE